MQIEVQYEAQTHYGKWMGNRITDEHFAIEWMPYHKYAVHLYEEGYPTGRIARLLKVPEALIVAILGIEGYK